MNIKFLLASILVSVTCSFVNAQICWKIHQKDNNFNPTIVPYSGIATGDFNSDGKTDLALVKNTNSTVSSVLQISLKSSGESYLAPVNYNIAAQNVQSGLLGKNLVVADFNGDTFLDIVVSSKSDSMNVMLNNGSGIFSNSVQKPGTFSNKLFSADMDGDGDIDILTQGLGDSLRILFNNGNATFTKGALIARAGTNNILRIEDVSIGFFNNDAFSDIVFSVSNVTGFPSALFVLTNNGNGLSFSQTYYSNSPFNTSWGDIDHADFDLDGDIDIIALTQTNTFTQFTNNGNASFTLTPSSTFNMSNTTRILVDDFNADNKPDIAMLGSNAVGARFGVRLNSSNSILTGTNQTVAMNSGPNLLFSADLNDDGRKDIMSNYYCDFFINNSYLPPVLLAEDTLYACGGAPVTFTAQGSGTLSWYSALNGGTYLKSGNFYTTQTYPAFGSYTYNFYVQDSSVCADPSGRTVVTLITIQLPQIDVLNNNTSVSSVISCKAAAVNLVATGANTYSWSTGVANAQIQYVLPSGTTYTNISVTGKDSYGCHETKNIAVFDAFMLAPTTGTVSNGALSGLSCNISGATYQWFDCNSISNIPGETSKDFYPTYSGNFAVIVSKNSCVDTTDCINYTLLSTGVINSINKENAFVYPNPFNDYILITSSEILQIELYDSIGNLVTQSCEKQINTHNLKSGVYIVKLKSNSGDLSIKKIVKY